MRNSQARFITACQTTLALGVVTAVLVPATTVVSLDVVVAQPSTGQVQAAVDPASVPTAQVPVAPVEPKVEEYAVVPEAEQEAAPQRRERRGSERREAPRAAQEPDAHEGHDHGLAEDVEADEVVEATVSAPVRGYGTVGVTWDADSGVGEGDIALQVRTRQGDEWSEWQPLEHHDAHAPEAGSPDAELARAGTDALIVGDVDEVEMRADAAHELPEGLSLAVVDPGTAETTEEAPAIDTDELSAPAGTQDAVEGDESDIALSAAARKFAAPKPTIYSRAQWGANESLRDKKSLRYGTISGGFVHHTVNANNYTADQVPGIIRSIYAYHTRSRGWSDLGYNFLVDRFGRIWEGRAGGVDKAVVGAHTLGYNDYSFAMSAIGNFETAKPSQAVVDAYSALMAWKLGLHGVDASSTKQRIGSRTFPAINGHRDAGSTACPGQYLYARLADIRKGATALQKKGTTTPEPSPEPTPTTPPAPTYATPVKDSDLVGSAHPDLVVRSSSTKRIMIIPTGGTMTLGAPRTVSRGWKQRGNTVASPDLTGDGRADVLSFNAKGAARVHAGDGAGGFGDGAKRILATRRHDQVIGVGDLDGDGRNDLVGRRKNGRTVGFLQTPRGGFRKVLLGRTTKRYDSLHAVGDITGDGRPDVVARDSSGGVWTLAGQAGPRLAAPVRTPGASGLTVAGGGDFTRDGRQDLLVRNMAGDLYALPGQGNGSFGLPQGPLGSRKNLTHLSVAPLTPSGLPDLVARLGNRLVVLANPGTFDLGTPVATGARAPEITALVNAGDFDGDGHGDVITIRGSNGALQLRRGNGTGALASPVRIGTGFEKVRNLEAVGDLDKDGKPDLIGTVGGKTYFYAGRGASPVAAGVAAANLTGPVGRMKSSGVYDPTQYDWKVAIADAHLASGSTDLLAREKATGHLFLFTASTAGLTGRRYLGGGMGAYDMAG